MIAAIELKNILVFLGGTIALVLACFGLTVLLVIMTQSCLDLFFRIYMRKNRIEVKEENDD